MCAITPVEIEAVTAEMEEEQRNELMSNPVERTALCAALRRNLAARSPQADESTGMNGFVRVKDILCNS